MRAGPGFDADLAPDLFPAELPAEEAPAFPAARPLPLTFVFLNDARRGFFT
jgi:hypothetical protein